MRQLLVLLLLLAAIVASGPALAQPAEPSPQQLRELAELLRDPGIQTWLQAQAEGGLAAAAEPPAAPELTVRMMVAAHVDMMHAFLRQLMGALPTLPQELAQAWRKLYDDSQDWGLLSILLLLAVFAILGFGIEWLFWLATARFRERLIATSLDTARERLHAVGRRFAYGVGMVLAFAIGSVGGFLLFDWPPLLREVVLAYLLVFLIIRLVLVLGRILFAPGAERFRVIPMATATARFWFVWSTVLVGWFAFVRITLDVLALLGVSRPAGYLIGLLCGVVLVGLSLYVVWRHPAAESGERTSRGHRVGAWLLSLYLVVVWLLLFTGSPTPFYVGITLLLLPIAIRCADLAVKHLLRPADGEAADAAVPSLTAVIVDRGLRAALLIGGAYLIAWFLGLDVAAMTMRDTMATRFLRGAINAVVILLLADFAWHLARAWIDCRLLEAGDAGPVRRGGDAAPRAPQDPAADPAQSAARGAGDHGPAHGAVGARRADRPADRRRRRGRRRHRLRCADPRQGHHLRHVLPARRRLPDRRVHRQRQLQGNGQVRSRCARSSSVTTAAISIPCRSASSARSRT